MLYSKFPTTPWLESEGKQVKSDAIQILIGKLFSIGNQFAVRFQIESLLQEKKMVFSI